MDRLVVVGASLAGLRAVEAARKAGFTGVVTLIGAEPHLPYDRPPLSKTFLEGKDGHATQADLTFRDEHTFAEDLDVDLMLGRPATAVDTQRKLVQVGSGDRVTLVPYDALVLATGTRARMIPGFDAFKGVHVLRTVDDACAIRDALRTGARTVVIGAGFIGSEIASSGRKLGAEVTILEALPVPLVRAIGEEMGAAIAHLHHVAGTPLHTGVVVERLVGDDAGHVRAVVLADGTQLPAELVVVGAGSIPNTEWLAGSGLQLHERDGGVICDATLFTGVDSVYAAGDIAWWPNPVFDGQLMRMENWTAAAEQGAMAARNAINSTEPKAYGTVPYFWSDRDHEVPRDDHQGRHPHGRARVRRAATAEDCRFSGLTTSGPPRATRRTGALLDGALAFWTRSAPRTAATFAVLNLVLIKYLQAGNISLLTHRRKASS